MRPAAAGCTILVGDGVFLPEGGDDTRASSCGFLCCSSYWSAALSEVDALRPPPSLVTEAFRFASLSSPLPSSESPLLWLYLSDSFLLASSSGWL